MSKMRSKKMMDNLFPRPNTLLMHLRGTCYINNKCRKGEKKENHNLLPYSFTFIPSFFFLNSGLRSRTWAVGLPPTTVLGFFLPEKFPLSVPDAISSTLLPLLGGTVGAREVGLLPPLGARRRPRLRSRPRTRRTHASWHGARPLPWRGGRRRRSSVIVA